MNEAETILKVKGVLWRVEKEVPDVYSEDVHISETDLDKWPRWHQIINNNDSIDTLKQTVTNIIQTYKL